MDTFLNDNKTEKRGVNKIMLAAILTAVVVVAGVVWLMTFTPTREEQKQELMAGAFYPGAPEFDNYTNNIIVTTNTERTSQSKIAIGTIQMAIHGMIRNKGTRVINLLELNVGVVDTKNQVIKEKRTLVVPNQSLTLNPNETISVFVPLDGFKESDDRANVRWKVTAIRFQ